MRLNTRSMQLRCDRLTVVLAQRGHRTCAAVIRISSLLDVEISLLHEPGEKRKRCLHFAEHTSSVCRRYNERLVIVLLHADQLSSKRKEKEA
jgi:hypothetical protein